MKGLRVLNTRPLNQGRALEQAIRGAGGLSINLPAIAISATDLNWLKTMPELNAVNQAIFISANAVNYYFEALKQSNFSWPAHITVIAVGNATAAALTEQGIAVQHVPCGADSEHLIQLEILQKIEYQRILLIKGVGGRSLIADSLLSRGANVTLLDVYRRDLPDIQQEYINSLWQDDSVDIILFTSEQAMNNLFSLFKGEGLSWLRNKPCLVISARLAQAASLLGIKTIITCQHDKLLDALYRYNQGVMHDNKP